MLSLVWGLLLFGFGFTWVVTLECFLGGFLKLGMMGCGL